MLLSTPGVFISNDSILGEKELSFYAVAYLHLPPMVGTFLA